MSSVLSRRRLQPADLCAEQVLTSLIQNQESETQVCVKQARLIRLSVASKSMLAEPADFDFYGPSGFHHSPLTNLK